jgi:hypothetical protein
VISPSPDCASDRVLDLLLAGDLDATRASALHEHVAACAECSARLHELSAFRDELARDLPPFPGLLVQTPPRPRRARRWSAWMGGALAAAAALVFWIGRGPAEDADETRVKGSARLGFYVKRGDSVFRGGQAEALRPGDAIEFSYAAPAAGYLAVLSVDGAGHASIYFPTGPRAQALEPGPQLLPQSTTLDAVLGRETLYALWCDAPAELEPIRRSLESSPAAPAAPGCSVELLQVEKRLP